MELFPFQIAAATEICEKFFKYREDPLYITQSRQIPFYQNLIAITGSGKTLILADAISQMRSFLTIEPIVLWVSKGKVVVWQTYTNLSSGRYAKLVSGYTVKTLLECRPIDIEKPNVGLILVATAAKFNQKDQEKGDRKIYQLSLDIADESLWNLMKKRCDSTGKKRPLIVVYDEGHNLSEQQTKLLLELEPDAIIAASATMRVSKELSNIVTRLRQDKEWTDQDFVTVVKSTNVVQSGLVKQHILLGGYVTPMEIALDDMISTMKRVESSSVHLELAFRPKAIYVSNTNVVSGGNNTDNINMLFEKRQARPILIWRYLVEKHKIPPSSIAVYCNLKFNPRFPPPPEFILFSGGDSDYDSFITGNYQHIIFNLTLQEGWDDPACYFAYIDKDMGSKEQITQVVGRVLRQPNAQHYPDPSLNTAHFFIRTDEKSVFEDVLEEVRTKISAEAPEIKLTTFTGGKGAANKQTLNPKRKIQLPDVDIDCTKAEEQIRKIIDSIQDFRKDNVNTIGKGEHVLIRQTIGSTDEKQEEWKVREHSNKVTARWIFAREVQKNYSRILNLCNIEEGKFDALVEYSSLAAEHLREAARKVVTAYITYSKVFYHFLNPKEVPAIPVDLANIDRFTHSLHEGYSDLNSLEREFARALDKTKHVWFRNSSKGLFEINLLTSSGAKHFNPDFIVWINNGIIAIDTKGDHLIRESATNKLFFIEKNGDDPDLLIRLVTQGTWNDAIEKIDNKGFTVWVLRNGKQHALPAKDVHEAVEFSLNITN